MRYSILQESNPTIGAVQRFKLMNATTSDSKHGVESIQGITSYFINFHTWPSISEGDLNQHQVQCSQRAQLKFSLLKLVHWNISTIHMTSKNRSKDIRDCSILQIESNRRLYDKNRNEMRLQVFRDDVGIIIFLSETIKLQYTQTYTNQRESYADDSVNNRMQIQFRRNIKSDAMRKRKFFNSITLFIYSFMEISFSTIYMTNVYK